MNSNLNIKIVAVYASKFFLIGPQFCGQVGINATNPRGILYVTRCKTLFLMLMCISLGAIAQVGVGTITPDGVLDLNSDAEKNMTGTNNYGLVLPRVALTRTDVATPLVNPQGGAPALGTVVYNINTTSDGEFSVYPGIYMWDGIDWINKFPKRDVEIYKQFQGTDGGPLNEWLRTETTGGYQDIPNMDALSFTPQYSGTYKIELSVNFGSGQADNIGASTDVAVQSGIFRFTFDGSDELIPMKSWSVHNAGSGTNYYDIWEQATIIYYRELVAGTSYSFSLAFDQTDSTGFINNGDLDGGSNEGPGWIGRDLPCSVEFNFLD